MYEVTTLADSGQGSLRDAVSTGNRTVVFKVGGVIELKSPLKILGDNLTIAGQTAPGDGITVIGYPTSFDGNNLIIRYMRFRLGDMNETEADSLAGGTRKILSSTTPRSAGPSTKCSALTATKMSPYNGRS